jgi:hypothetical protein
MNEMVLLKNRKKPKKINQEIVCMSSQRGGGNDGRGIYIYLAGGREPDLGSRYASFGRCSSSRV